MPNEFHYKLRYLLLFWGLLLVCLFLYSILLQSAGAFNTDYFHQQWFEALLVIYIYTLVYISIKPGFFRPLISALPVFLLYLIHDVFFLVYSKVFRFINFSETSELLQILPFFQLILLILIMGIPLSLIIFRVRKPRYRLLGLAYTPLIVVITILFTTPSQLVQLFDKHVVEIVKYSDAKSVNRNGRITMMLYREAQRLYALETIAPYRNNKNYQEKVAQVSELLKTSTRNNIHLVVLESFIDPRSFSKLGFSMPPAHPEYEKLFNRHSGYSKAPIFGGATAQSEFEVLCGVPAFERLSSIEFNVFSGNNANCLSGLLSNASYRTVATNAYKPNFFNIIAGYQGTGFTELHFPQEFYTATSSYLKAGDPGIEYYMFDGDLFDQNLAFVKKHIATSPGKPLFNYIMTIYGHLPHALDTTKRPEIIKLDTPYPDDQLLLATNQFYYRTAAIAKYVKQLMTVDPDSLIILIGDHVPPLRNGPNTYNALAYLPELENGMLYTPFTVFENGKQQQLQNIHHYDIPDIVLNYLSKGKYCLQNTCAHLGKPALAREKRMNDYMQLMAHAMQ